MRSDSISYINDINQKSSEIYSKDVQLNQLNFEIDSLIKEKKEIKNKVNFLGDELTRLKDTILKLKTNLTTLKSIKIEPVIDTVEFSEYDMGDANWWFLFNSLTITGDGDEPLQIEFDAYGTEHSNNQKLLEDIQDNRISQGEKFIIKYTLKKHSVWSYWGEGPENGEWEIGLINYLIDINKL